MVKSILSFGLVIILMSCATQESHISVEYKADTKTFWDYKCTQDCSWHKAGYNWAKKKWINSINRCWWNNQSFIEGCYQYVQDNF